MAYFDRFVAFTTMIDDIGKSIQKIKTDRMERFGLQSTDALCLAVLSRRPEGLSLTALAAACRLDKAAVSRAMHRLFESGNVAYRESATKNTYRAPLVLTDKGKAVVDAMRELAADAVTHASADVSPESLEILYTSLEQIRKSLARYASELEQGAQDK